MATLIEGPLTSIALCWQLERSDGAGVALTSHDSALQLGGVFHLPAPGLDPAAITRNLGIEPHSSEVAGALHSSALADEDLALGRWDGARAKLSAVDWQDEAGEALALLGGELGTVAIDGETFSAELRGAASKLEAPVCPSTSAECRAELGDKHCRVDLAGRTIYATVVSSVDGELTVDRAVDANYLLGRLRYLSGPNCGLSTIVIAVDGPTVSVRDLPRAPVASGCSVELREGCDKRFQTCSERFANAVNFRGEPHLPGTDLLTRYPGV